MSIRAIALSAGLLIAAVSLTAAMSTPVNAATCKSPKGKHIKCPPPVELLPYVTIQQTGDSAQSPANSTKNQTQPAK